LEPFDNQERKGKRNVEQKRQLKKTEGERKEQEKETKEE
jgi:hypothetical protein